MLCCDALCISPVRNCPADRVIKISHAPSRACAYANDDQVNHALVHLFQCKHHTPVRNMKSCLQVSSH